jgi:uncharacterized protein (DUF4415 family)
MNGSRRDTGSDLSKVDAHAITQAEYDEVPELQDEFFERADHHEAGRLVRRGRPKSEHPKVAISIRLSEDVLNRFKAAGPGWQSRIETALRDWLASHPGRP